MRTYTVYEYRPAYPMTGIHRVVCQGTISDNRDSMPPTVTWYIEIRAKNKVDAAEIAKYNYGRG